MPPRDRLDDDYPPRQRISGIPDHRGKFPAPRRPACGPRRGSSPINFLDDLVDERPDRLERPQLLQPRDAQELSEFFRPLRWYRCRLPTCFRAAVPHRSRGVPQPSACDGAASANGEFGRRGAGKKPPCPPNAGAGGPSAAHLASQLARGIKCGDLKSQVTICLMASLRRTWSISPQK